MVHPIQSSGKEMTAAKSLVLVAGAGASREAGLPLGDELREQIRDAVDPRPERLSDQGAGRFFRKGFNLLPNRNTYGELELYDKARDRLYRGMQTAVSIDNFLDNHYNDKHLNACGKLAIASCILQAEANTLRRQAATKMSAP
jgi:hypothetical protein